MQADEGNDESKIRVNITISPDVHDTGKAIAKRDKRTFSNLVEVLIEKEKERVAVSSSPAQGSEVGA